MHLSGAGIVMAWPLLLAAWRLSVEPTGRPSIGTVKVSSAVASAERGVEKLE
jgi:hypothetical protein